MRKTIFLIFVFLLCSCSALTIPSRPDSLGYDEIKFSRKEPETWTMENGLRVFYLYNDELPQVSATLYFPGGTLYEPANKLGLSGLAGALMREGGIRGMSPEAFDKRLDDLAASIETGFSNEYGTASFFSLEEDFAEVFSYFAEVVLRPAFSAKRMELIKRLSIKGIKNRKDDPDTIAAAAFSQLLYGVDSPYGRIATSSHLASLSLADIRKFHQRFMRPNGSYLAISGSVKKEQVQAVLEKHFAGWAADRSELPKLPKVSQQIKAGVYLHQSKFEQARIYIGHRGPERIPPDLHSLIVFNQYFGHGSFGSLLFSRIRSQLGLAYTVYGGVVPDNPEGRFEIYLATRVDEAARAINETLSLVDQSIVQLPDASSYKDAKSKISRSYVFKFRDLDSIVDRSAILKVLGYPEDYDQTYLEKISKITQQDMLDSAKKNINPDELIIVVVGNISKKELKQGLARELPIYEFGFNEVPRF